MAFGLSKKSAQPLKEWDGHMLANAMPDPLMIVDPQDRISFVNLAAENFFQAGVRVLQGKGLNEIIAFDSPLMTLVGQVRNRASSISEYGLTVDGPRMNAQNVDAQISPIMDEPGFIIITLRERGIASKLDHQLIHRGAARSVTSMASVLAHEIKNPLSGIRGAAQLVEMNLDSEGRSLTRLICEETDRICALVDRMEVFSDPRPLEPQPVNVHQVIEHAMHVAENGFAKHVTFHEQYDPSIPSVPGDRDQLIQVMINLIKNAAEAVPEEGGEISLTTAYRHGVRVAMPGTRERMNLPLEICVIDNGGGVPEDMRPYLFDPFVTTKSGGTGLGLALVAKIIGDHGGIIECESQPKRTIFRIMLPIFTGPFGGETS